MRELKFRGLDANGAMRYGRLSQDKPGSTLYYDDFSQRICWDDSNIPVSNKTLGQFTGLHDSKGQEVWEGDIVQFDGLIPLVVGYQNGFFGWANLCPWMPIHTRLRDLDGEVIGDIHQHPELLQGEG